MTIDNSKEPRQLNLQAYLREKEAAEMIGRTDKALRNLRSQGRGPIYYKTEGVIQYKVQDLLDYMTRCRIVPKKSALDDLPLGDSGTISFMQPVFSNNPLVTKTNFIWVDEGLPHGFIPKELNEIAWS